MNILTLETATAQCSCALALGDQILCRSQHAPTQHAELLLPMIKSVLDEAGMSLSQVDVLGFCRGPGSFTGLRIGASVTQGLAFGHDIPVAPISTLHLLAHEVFLSNPLDPIFAVIDARKHQIYCAGFKPRGTHLTPIYPEALLHPADLPETKGIGVGNGLLAYPEIQSKFQRFFGDIVPEAQYMIELVKKLSDEKGLVSAEFAIPIYLRDKIC